jgi:hypothetical protein
VNPDRLGVALDPTTCGSRTLTEVGWAIDGCWSSATPPGGAPSALWDDEFEDWP